MKSRPILILATTIAAISGLASNPALAQTVDCVNPLLVSNVDPNNALALNVAVSLPYACLASSDLFIYDVSDSTSPQQIGMYDPGAYLPSDEVCDVHMVGDLAYLGTEQGVTILDVSTPSSPVRLSHVLIGGGVSQVDVAGNLCFLATRGPNPSAIILDVSDALHPVVMATEALPSEGYAIGANGSVMIVGLSTGGVRVYDISTPSSLLLVGTLDTPDLAAGSVSEIKVNLPVAMIATSSGIHTVDLQDPSAPSVTATLAVGGEGFALTDETVYIANGRLWVIDRTTPGSLTLIGMGFTPGLAVGAAYADGHVYVADYNNGLSVLDVRDDCRIPCPADTNGDGILDNGDIITFVSLFLAGDPAADTNADGILDNGDIITFVALFLAGC